MAGPERLLLSGDRRERASLFQTRGFALVGNRVEPCRLIEIIPLPWTIENTRHGGSLAFLTVGSGERKPGRALPSCGFGIERKIGSCAVRTEEGIAVGCIDESSVGSTTESSRMGDSETRIVLGKKRGSKAGSPRPRNLPIPFSEEDRRTRAAAPRAVPA